MRWTMCSLCVKYRHTYEHDWEQIDGGDCFRCKSIDIDGMPENFEGKRK